MGIALLFLGKHCLFRNSTGAQTLWSFNMQRKPKSKITSFSHLAFYLKQKYKRTVSRGESRDLGFLAGSRTIRAGKLIIFSQYPVDFHAVKCKYLLIIRGKRSILFYPQYAVDVPISPSKVEKSTIKFAPTCVENYST